MCIYIHYSMSMLQITWEKENKENKQTKKKTQKNGQTRLTEVKASKWFRKENNVKSVIHPIIAIDTSTHLTWLDLKRKGFHQTFLLILSPLCLTDTRKSKNKRKKEGKRTTAIRPPQEVELSFLFQNKTAVCVDISIYMYEIYMSVWRIDMKAPLSSGPRSDGKMSTVPLRWNGKRYSEELLLLHFFPFLLCWVGRCLLRSDPPVTEVMQSVWYCAERKIKSISLLGRTPPPVERNGEEKERDLQLLREGGAHD